jgi:hypothetical protein
MASYRHKPGDDLAPSDGIQITVAGVSLAVTIHTKYGPGEIFVTLCNTKKYPDWPLTPINARYCFRPG